MSQGHALKRGLKEKGKAEVRRAASNALVLLLLLFGLVLLLRLVLLLLLMVGPGVGKKCEGEEKQASA